MITILLSGMVQFLEDTTGKENLSIHSIIEFMME